MARSWVPLCAWGVAAARTHCAPTADPGLTQYMQTLSGLQAYGLRHPRLRRVGVSVAPHRRRHWRRARRPRRRQRRRLRWCPAVAAVSGGGGGGGGDGGGDDGGGNGGCRLARTRGATKQRTRCSAQLACRYRGRGAPMVQPQVRSCEQGCCGAAGGAAAHRSVEHLSKSVQRAGLEEASQQPALRQGDEPRFMSRSLGTISAICRRTRGRDRRSARLISGRGMRRQAAHRSHKSRVLRVIRRAGC